MNYVHRFTFAELLGEAASPPLGREGVSDRRGDNGSGTYTYDEAETLLREGWADGVAKLEPILATLRPDIAAHIERVDWRLDVEPSGEIDMGAYLDNDPECWMNPNTVVIAGQGKMIHLLVNCGFRSNRSERQIWTFGAAVTALVEALEIAGHNVKLTYARISRREERGHVSSCYVTLKDWGEPLMTGRLVFALAHPAMLRRIMFRVNERYPASERDAMGFHADGGYGQSSDFKYATEMPEADITIDRSTEIEPREIVTWVIAKLAEQGVTLKQ